MKEIWKDIKEFKGYQVSNFGRVRSFRPPNGVGDFVDTPRLMKPDIGKKGHLRVPLRKNKKAYKKFVHTLVLEAFVRVGLDNEECRHLDGNPTNNHVLNLKWGTTFENRQDRIKHGNNNHGEAHGRSILSEDNVLEVIDLLKIGETHQSIANIFDVDRSTITKININRNWRYLRNGNKRY